MKLPRRTYLLVGLGGIGQRVLLDVRRRIIERFGNLDALPWVRFVAIDTDMGEEAGLKEIAEPPSLVPEAIIAALATDEFHVFPDSMAKQIGGAYQSFAENVVLQEMAEG